MMNHTKLEHLSGGRVRDEWGNEYIEQDRATQTTPRGTCDLFNDEHLQTSVCRNWHPTKKGELSNG